MASFFPGVSFATPCHPIATGLICIERAINYCGLTFIIHFFYKNTQRMPSLIFLDFSDFEPRIILKYHRPNFAKKYNEYIPIFVDVLLHHKTKQEFIFCIDNAKVHLKAVL